MKPLGTKVSGLEIELALGVGVFAAGGEGDEAEAVAGVEAAEAVLDPALLVGFGESVVVDDGVPVGIGGEVVGERGAAEDAADVVGVLPGVVDEVSMEVGEWEAVGGFEDLEGGGFEAGEAWVGFEDFGGALILGFDPGDGASP